MLFQNIYAGVITGSVSETFVESRTGGQNFAWYSENGVFPNSWQSSGSKSTAPGLTAGIGSRFNSDAGFGGASTWFQVAPVLPTAGGVYDVYVTMTTASGAITATSDIAVTGGTGLPTSTTAFSTAQSGNAWALVGTLTLDAGVNAPTIRFHETSHNNRFYADAVLFAEKPSIIGHLVSTWDGTTNNWTSNHWSTANYPNHGNGGYTYDAVISSGTVTLDQNIALQGLTLSGNGTIITGSSNLTLNASSSWTTGTMSGGGQTRVAAGGSIALTGGGGTRRLNRTFINDGTATFDGGSNALRMNGGTFQNNGTFTATAFATRTFAGESGTNIFNNAGTFTKTGTGTLEFVGSSVIFNNSGTVDVQQGQLLLFGDGTHTGTFTGAANTTLRFRGNHSFSAASSISTTGGVTFDGGTTTINGAFLEGSLNLLNSGIVGVTPTVILNTSPNASGGQLASGLLTGPADWTVTGALTLNGASLTGSGKLIIAPAATLTLQAIGDLNFQNGLGRTLINNGTTISNSSGSFVANGTFQNNGTFTAGAGFIIGKSGTNTFNNAGTFTKIGAGEYRFGNINESNGIQFNNSGTVDIQAGKLSLQSGGVQTGDFVGAAGATLQLAGNHTFAAGADITGDLNIEFFTDSHLFAPVGISTINSSISTTGAITFHVFDQFAPAGLTTTFNGSVSAGSLNLITGATVSGAQNGATAILNAPVTTSAGTIAHGTLTGPANWTVNGPLTWTGGVMAGTGQTIPASGTISGSGSKTLDERTLRLAGNVSWSGGDITTTGTRGTIHVPDGATFTVSGSDTKTLNANLLIDPGGTLLHTSTGSTMHTGGTFVNNGLVQVDAGTLSFNNGGSGTGTFVVAAGATLLFNGPGHNYSGGVSLDGGTLEVDTFTLTNGTVQGSGTIQATTFSNASVVSPGIVSSNQVGEIYVNGAYEQTSNGNLELDIEGTAAGEFDTLDVSDAADLGGTLSIDASNLTISGTQTQEFEIITAGNLSGEFDTVAWSGGGDIYFFPDYNYDDGIVRIVQGTRGDMNGDGAIDTLDVDLFVFILMSGSEFKFLNKAIADCDANNRICELPSSQAGGDWNGSGLVDFDDIPYFQDVAIGNGLGAGALEAAVARYLSQPTTVPEPSAAVFLPVTALIVLATRRKRPGRRKRA